jgi:hypothetical protein
VLWSAAGMLLDFSNMVSIFLLTVEC